MSRRIGELRGECHIEASLRIAVCGAIRLREAAMPPIATSTSISTRSLIVIGCRAVARADCHVGCFGGKPRVGGGDRDEGVERGVQALDAREVRVHEVK